MTLRDLYDMHIARCEECKKLGGPCLTARRILSAAATVKIVKKVVIIKKKGE